LDIEEFWKQAEAGAVKFAWVSINDNKVCADCAAIAGQADPEGYTWEEWRAFGLPKAGHTVCLGNCRCRLVPLLYVDISTELQDAGLIIMENGDVGERMKRIQAMIRAYRDAGHDTSALSLVGQSEADMEAYLKAALEIKGVEFSDDIVG